MIKITPFGVGDQVIIKKPGAPLSGWPPEMGTYAFGICEKNWDTYCGKLVEIIRLTYYQGCAAVIVSGCGTYCWPVECVSPWRSVAISTNSKVPCDCPAIFILGCQDKRNHV